MRIDPPGLCYHHIISFRLMRSVHCIQDMRILPIILIFPKFVFPKHHLVLIIMPPLPSRSQLLTIRSNDSSLRSTSSTFSVNDGAAISCCGGSSECCAGTSYTTTSNHGVNFNLESNSIHEVSARSELSREEFCQLWYTEEDLKIIRSDLRIVTRMMKSGRFHDEEKDGENNRLCFRGIELDREKDQRLERQGTILMELFWSESKHFFDSEVPIKLQKLTSKAKREALIRAKQDQEAAMKIYRHR